MRKSILEEITADGFSLQRLTESLPQLSALKETPQNPEYHGEGDVYCHTEMVCRELRELPQWQTLCPREQALLYLATAFHDIGKPVCTKLENGSWVSPRHSVIGEKEFRGIAYREAGRLGLTFQEREFVAKCIRYHGLPVWFWAKARPEFELYRAAESVPLRLLSLLSKADVLGRITSAPEHLSEHVELFADYVKELGLWEGPHSFANPYTKFQYFHKNDLWCNAELYDDTEFDVVLMSGLPLSGKDTWIEKNGGETPMISLDNLREKMRIPPTKGSGRVAQAALEQARIFLRRKQPFIWNATNIIQETRQKLVTLFAGYGARVHLIYLEVPYDELLERNHTRARSLPETVLEEMIQKLEIPAPWEAYEVRLLS